jgi:hypothetical protein
MEPLMIALAFAAGFAAQMVRLPPLIGFLAAATFGSYSKLNFPAVYLMFLWAISDLELRKARSGSQGPAPRSSGGTRSARARG